MKKITRLLLLAAISIGMVACSNDDVPQTPESLRGTTYASIAVTLPKAPSTKTLQDDYHKLTDDWEGIDKINTITVFLVNETLGTIDHSTFGTSQFKSIQDGVLKPNLAVKGTPGERVKAYVVLNGNTAVLTTLKTTTPGAFAGVYAKAVAKNASDLASNDGTKDEIMMTNTVLPTAIAIEANVDEATAKAGTKNSVKVEVERVVSRAIVTVNDGATLTVNVQNANKENKSIITIKDLKYVVGQSNKEFYMIKQKDYVTPDAVYNFVPTAENWMTAVKGDKAIFDNTGLADAKRSTVLNAKGAAVLADFSDALTGEGTASKFVLPVTHETTNYRKGNTTFFEVIATFTPDKVDGEGTYSPGSDVFMGMNDGLFYTSKESAEAKGQKATHYKGDGNTTDGGAIMKYVLWLNPNVIPGTAGKKASMSPTVRNQVYHAHITGFKQIGLPNNPLNPDDPNDPLNPKNPIDPSDPLETNDTYLSVEITVLPWGIHSYEIDLGNDY